MIQSVVWGDTTLVEFEYCLNFHDIPTVSATIMDGAAVPQLDCHILLASHHQSICLEHHSQPVQPSHHPGLHHCQSPCSSPLSPRRSGSAHA